MFKQCISYYKTYKFGKPNLLHNTHFMLIKIGNKTVHKYNISEIGLRYFYLVDYMGKTF